MGNGPFRSGGDLTVCGGAFPSKDTMLSGKGPVPLPHLLGENMNRILCGTALLAILSSPVMAQDAFVLDDIVFSAGLTPLEAARAGVVVGVIDEEELRAAGEVPLPDLLATVPGVSFTRNGPPGTSTSLRIRGAGRA
jgi:outer membrane receptor for ferrienterochelin and colicin